MMRGRYIRESLADLHTWEVAAGWHDARRTPDARPWRGTRWGGLDYAAGYAVGATIIPAWNAAVSRAWYALGCPPRFPLRRIVRTCPMYGARL